MTIGSCPNIDPLPIVDIHPCLQPLQQIGRKDFWVCSLALCLHMSLLLACRTDRTICLVCGQTVQRNRRSASWWWAWEPTTGWLRAVPSNVPHLLALVVFPHVRGMIRSAAQTIFGVPSAQSALHRTIWSFRRNRHWLPNLSVTRVGSQAWST